MILLKSKEAGKAGTEISLKENAVHLGEQQDNSLVLQEPMRA